jgi:tRNA wybutosine-synthesizing protein 3
VFLEGRKANVDDSLSEEHAESRAGPGGKGGGGAWLYISHTPIENLKVETTTTYMSLFGLQDAASKKDSVSNIQSRYIHLKFEPMVSRNSYLSTTRLTVPRSFTFSRGQHSMPSACSQQP